MKKMLCMILALVMVFSLSVSAMADGSWDGTNYTDNTQKVTATYTGATDASNAGNIYSVIITWSDVTVAYKGAVGGTYTWDPEDLVYKLTGNVDAEWTDGSITIGVENRSNAAITATATYAPAGSETLTFGGALDLGSAAIDTANGNATIDFTDTTTSGEEQTGTITGDMGGTITAGGELGTITVTLGKKA